MNILVTGGTGFIGGHLANRLAGMDHSVTVPVRENSHTGFLHSESIHLKNADLFNYREVSELADGMDVIFHLASIRGSGWEYTDRQIWDINTRITENLLRASAGGLKQFIYISSVSVYGHFTGGPADEHYPFSTVTRYGKTKYESEKIVQNYQKEQRHNTTIIRPVITYGPGDARGMMTKLIRLILAGRYLTVGTGENRVHLIYIDDLIDGLVRVIGKEDVSGESFLLAGQRPVTVNRLVKIVETYVKKKVPGVHVPLWFAIPSAHMLEICSRAFFIKKEPLITRDKIDIMSRDRFFTIEKAKRCLGFNPSVDYTEGVAKTVEWLKQCKYI